MSRNVRQKYPTAPAKTAKRRGSDSSSLNLSDDDGYSGVEDISDSDDDDEEHVHAAEENHIISNELRQAPSGAPRPLLNDDSDADEADGEDEEDDEDGLDDDDDDDNIEQGDDGVSWDGILSDIDDGAASDLAQVSYILDQDVAHIERHVRFTGVPDSDSDSTATDTDTTRDIDGFFPDLFVEQNALDPAFRREIEYDPDESSNSGSFWDFHSSQDQLGPESDDDIGGVMLEDDTPTATPGASQAPTEVSTPTPVPSGEVQELDGYESESGLIRNTRWGLSRLSMLMRPHQPMATPLKMTSPSHLFARSSLGGARPRACHRTLIPNGPFGSGVASRAWDAII